MQTRHIILIVLIGTGLIIIAPSAKNAGQVSEKQTASNPSVQRVPEEMRRASLDEQTGAPEDIDN